ncbi:MAG: hypothetical protein HYZ50_12500 [Deltaproteobacteria bacterium]|nr:hypothetical protein [Deltaproteobacteria bacterium]
MTGHGEKASRKVEQAVVALLTHVTVGEAAQAIGVSASTLLRWLRREDFQAQYRNARREAVNQAIACLQQGSSEAVQTLCTVMKDASLSAAARVSAAKTVLELSIKVGELEDLAARVEALEEQQRR